MKVVLQDGIKDCGVCSLLSIIRYYGGDVSKEYLRDLTNTTKSGVSAYKLVEAAEKLGFRVEALNGEIEKINVNNLPCIAHVIINKSYQHFIVIYKLDFDSGKVQIMDPARGKKVISLSEFKLMSSSNYIFLSPIKKLPKLQQKQIIKDTIKIFGKSKKSYLVYLFILTISYFILNVLSAFHFKYLLDFSVNYLVSYNIPIISFFVFLIYFFKELSFFLRNLLLVKFGNLLDEVITTKTYKQIVLLPYLYYKNRTSGEVISRMCDLSYVKSFLSELFCSITTDLLSLFIFIVFLFKINTKISLFIIIYSLVYILFSVYFQSGKKKSLNNLYNAEEKINSYLIESLSSVDVLKGMHIEKRIFDRFRIKYKSFLNLFYLFSRKQEIETFIKNNMNNIFMVFILYLGTYYVVNQKLKLGEFIVYQSIFGFYFSSLKNIISLISNYPTYKLSLERVEDLFSIKREMFQGSSYYDIDKIGGDIIYHNLDFSYHYQKLLTSINLIIHQYDKIFLCGPSGSGKSTLMKLLVRYMEVPYGKISIDGIDINHYHLDILRKNIVYVSQQEFLFNDTMYHNITLYKDVSKEKLSKILEITGVNEILDSNHISYNDLVEENGFNFSGGERQRIILARSLLKDGEVYIFDEALSQIDIVRERKILENIFSYLHDKTIIVISHRFDNKDLFSRVLTIKEGIIYEEDI